ITARFPLSFVWRFIKNDITDDCVAGNGRLSFQLKRGPSSRLDGQLVVEDVCYKKKKLCDTSKLTVTRRDYLWRGDISIRAHRSELAGAWQWNDKTQIGDIHLTNITSVPLPRFAHWHI
ncbi:MAG: hypothetical protein CUN56_16830, partial [Phototrophicales bacterium]